MHSCEAHFFNLENIESLFSELDIRGFAGLKCIVECQAAIVYYSAGHLGT